MLKNDVFSCANHSMKGLKKELLQQGGVILFFIVLSLVFFSPVLQGKRLYQSDIGQYKGMAKERNDYKEKTGIESYWTNNAFGGMPTYQLGANYPHDYVKRLDRIIRFLPRPADYLFLYLIGFYVFLISLKLDWKWAVLGALAYGFSTYFIIILEVGHNAKAHALGYAPMVLAGLMWLFRGRYFWGGLIFTLAMAFEISANHYQMTYYLMLLIGLFMLHQAWLGYRHKNWKSFGLKSAIFIAGLLLAIGTNATGIMATKEYADWSTRGKSSLELSPEGLPKENTSGLSKEYITQYSYGIAESLNLFSPRLFGGSNGENLGTDSKTYQYLIAQGASHRQAAQFSESLPLYWGAQPIVAAPAYIGAVIFFLFILALFLVKGPLRLWLLLGTLFSLILSWGKNMEWLTNLMIDYFPLYDKFRAVSSIQVILEMCVPALAIMGAYAYFKGNNREQEKQKALYWAGGISVGICLLLLLFKGNFSFEAISDSAYLEYYGAELMAMIQEDRRQVYSADLWRSILFMIGTFALLWLGLKSKVKELYFVLALGSIILLDLYSVANRYLSEEDYVSKRRIETPFNITEADRQIQQDTSHYRVFDLNEGVNGARTNFFHKSLGGYHAAKPRSLEELFEYQIYQGNDRVIDMLNVKYFMQRGEEGQRIAQRNPAAFGNAWFVDTLQLLPNADAIMKKMGAISLRNTALAVKDEVKSTEFKEFTIFETDSLASIELIQYKPHQMVYESVNNKEGLAVFSEMYYPHGWKVQIDGASKEMLKVNHALRALLIPAGSHTITFSFEPEVVQRGSMFSLFSFLLLCLLTVYGLVQKYIPERFPTTRSWLMNSEDA